jgi:transcriptional regulator with XRE-family HTH domain
MPNTGQDLAGAITTRRVELGLSQSAAARRAGVSRPAWLGWETGSRPQDSNYATIERTLEWERGTVHALLTGAPTPPVHNEHSPPPAGIDPKAWARWDPIDREMVLNAIRIADKRAAQRITRKSDSALSET